MRKTSKWLALILAIVLLVALFAGCASDNASTGDDAAADDSSASSSSSANDGAGVTTNTDASDTTLEESDMVKEFNGTVMTEAEFASLGSTAFEQSTRTDIDKAIPTEYKEITDIHVGYEQFSGANSFFAQEMSYIAEYCESLGMKCTVLDAQDSIETESQNFDTLVSMGVDVIIADIKDPTAAVNDVKRCVEAGVPVIGVDSAMDGEAPIVCEVMPSAFDNGFMCGVEEGKALADVDIVAGVISGQVGNPVGEMRRYGQMSGIVYARLQNLGYEPTVADAAQIARTLFNDIEANGKGEIEGLGFKVVGQGWGTWTDEGGMTAAEDILTANPDLNCFICENCFMAMGAYKAVNAAGLADQIFIGSSADGSQQVLDAIKEGTVFCTGQNNPSAQVRGAVDLAVGMLTGAYDFDTVNSLPFFVYLDSACITAENVDDYYPTSGVQGFTMLVPFDWDDYFAGNWDAYKMPYE